MPPIHKAEKFNARSIRRLIARRIDRNSLFGEDRLAIHRNLVRMMGPESVNKNELLSLLAVAEMKLRSLGDKPVWSSYDSGPAIADFVAHARHQIANDLITQCEKSELWGIFAPTCDWDDVIGEVELGSDIFAMLDSAYGGDVHFPARETET